jgi:hypothetical protein
MLNNIVFWLENGRFQTVEGTLLITPAIQNTKFTMLLAPLSY